MYLCHTSQFSSVGGWIGGEDHQLCLNLGSGVEGMDVQGGLGHPSIDAIMVDYPFSIGHGHGCSLCKDGDWECHTDLKNGVEVLMGAQACAHEVYDSGGSIRQYPAMKIVIPANPKRIPE